MFGQNAPIDPTDGFAQQIKDLRARIGELERRASDNGVSADITGITAATGWGSVTLDYCRRVGPLMLFQITATRTGSALAAGDFANTDVCTLTGSGTTGSTNLIQPLTSGNAGPVVAGLYQSGNGLVRITAAATSVTTSSQISLGGCVLVDV